MTTTTESGATTCLTKLSDLNDLAKKSGKKRLAVAVAHDEHCLEAICAVDKMGMVEAVLVGNEKKIREIAKKLNLDVSGMKIIHEEIDANSVKIAVKMVRNHEADILMKGNVPTATFLRGVLDKENGLRKGEVLSHFALFELPTYHKLLGLTDAAMILAPDFKTKVALTVNAVEFMNKLGYTKPKVAVLAAVEMVNEAMQATLDGALLSKMSQRGQIKNCIIDGPLAYDNAVSAASAKHKGIVSEVAGDADLLIAPDIEAGNVLYKAWGFSANAKLAAVVLGAAAPIVLTSRSDTEESKQASIVMAAAI
ncbi:MAG: bifunctional enoyl-CoA hydratase/phosphate acetyltransferase [Bacteroidetes bacterium]|nr:bifunctional enoyl-CoA hydratase/phosphate acetyltransferase [Bacteroidota bacterium]